MWWKIIAFLYAFCFSWELLLNSTYYETPFRIIGLVLGVLGIVGLFQLALNKRFFSQRFWKPFTVIYIGYAAVGLLSGAKTVIDAHGIWSFVMAVAISFVFQGPVVVGLWRLSFGTAEAGLRQSAETAAS